MFHLINSFDVCIHKCKKSCMSPFKRDLKLKMACLDQYITLFPCIPAACDVIIKLFFIESRSICPLVLKVVWLFVRILTTAFYVVGCIGSRTTVTLLQALVEFIEENLAVYPVGKCLAKLASSQDGFPQLF